MNQEQHKISNRGVGAFRSSGKLFLLPFRENGFAPLYPVLKSETAAESTPATEQTTEAAGTAKGGCGSVASLGGVALLMALGTACAAVDSKKRSRK